MNGRWTRFVALGDSLTEGIGDPDPLDRPRGWADRFAAELARRQGGLRYANLAVRGLTTAEVLRGQLPVAQALRPDLASVIVGMNDLVRPSAGLRSMLTGYDRLLDGMIDAGATVLTATLPEPVVLPLPEIVRKRFTTRLHRFNAHVRASARRRGALCLDLAGHAVTDTAGWSADRLHPSPYGHQVVADEFLDLLTGTRSDHREPRPLDAPTALVGLVPQLRWIAAAVTPWLLRRASGKPPVGMAKASSYLVLGPA